MLYTRVRSFFFRLVSNVHTRVHILWPEDERVLLAFPFAAWAAVSKRDNVVLLMGRNDGGLTTNRLSSNGRCAGLHAREAGSQGGETSGRKQEIVIGKKKNHTLWPAVECAAAHQVFFFLILSIRFYPLYSLLLFSCFFLSFFLSSPRLMWWHVFKSLILHRPARLFATV